MNDLQAKAAVTGLLFGIWPLLMNRSGLSGNAAAVAYSIIVAALIAPIAARGLGDLSHAKWSFAIGAGVAGALGVAAFSNMLSKATPQSVGSLFIIMIIVQIAVPAAYDVIVNKSMAASKAAGFALAFASAILLIR